MQNYTSHTYAFNHMGFDNDGHKNYAHMMVNDGHSYDGHKP